MADESNRPIDSRLAEWLEAWNAKRAENDVATRPIPEWKTPVAEIRQRANQILADRPEVKYPDAAAKARAVNELRSRKD